MRFVARTRILGYIFDLLFFVWLGGDPGKEVENERHEGGERERTKFPGTRGWRGAAKGKMRPEERWEREDRWCWARGTHAARDRVKRSDEERETERRRTFYASYVVHAHSRVARGVHTIWAHRRGGILTHGIPVVGSRGWFSWQRGWVLSPLHKSRCAPVREAISSRGEFDPSRHLHRFTRVTEYLVSDRHGFSLRRHAIATSLLRDVRRILLLYISLADM